jgi:DNA-binding SARP family transcriptional activator
VIEVTLMGGLVVHRDGARLDLGGPRQRRVLALLALSIGRPIPSGRLIDLVWGDDAPPSARQTLQSYVSNLRRALGKTDADGPILVGRDDAYVLDLASCSLDTARFEGLVREGLGRRAAGEQGEAIMALTAALALHRPLLPELEDHPCAVAERARIDALAAAAVTTQLEARVDRSDDLAVADLRAAVVERPTEERLWACLALALYRSGRQAEALAAVAEARTHLAELAGLEPGPLLRHMEADLLAQAPSLGIRPANAPMVRSGTSSASSDRRPHRPHAVGRRCRVGARSRF